MFSRAAVSRSIAHIPKAASPMNATASFSGAATFAPMMRPSDEPSWCAFPQPKYERGSGAR
jgi:hypothetical protein